MTPNCLIETASSPEEIVALRASEIDSWISRQPALVQEWVQSSDFNADPHSFLRLPPSGAGYLLGVGEREDRWSYSSLPSSLPARAYCLPENTPADIATQAALGWALGAYRYTRYKPLKREMAKLIWPKNADRAAVERDIQAVTLARDLINTPALDLGPAELCDASVELAKEFGASYSVLKGEQLAREGYGLIYAVGRGSPRDPHLVDIIWGDENAPKVTLVGKGVCFDTGGLTMKQESGMLFMKADMGGAAHALALARMIMHANLPVRLRVLIPAVENSVSGESIRPLDVVRARNGKTVEIANTDAEGRLILADALAEGSRENPDLLLDFATLTGSARVALGTEIQALFANNDEIACALEASARATNDPLWRLPLWREYAKDIEGKVGELTNVADLNLGFTTLAGAIYASLFMEQFVAENVNWVHLDIMGWNFKSRPGRPEGGEARSLFCVFHFLEKRYNR